MHFTIEKITDKNHVCIPQLCEWNFEWWGKDRGDLKENVLTYLQHSTSTDGLPMLFVAFDKQKPIGMFQLAWQDDLWFRPDLFPWVSNVFVDENYRGKGVGKMLMQRASHELQNLGHKTAYLRTSHDELYERFGWVYFDKVKKWYPSKSGEYTKIYKLDIS